MGYIVKGTKLYRRVNIALASGAFTTFAVLYSVQPLLPELAEHYHVSPAASSLALSVSTLSLAVCMPLVAGLSDTWGRKRVMTISLVATAAIAFITAFSPSFEMLIGLRLLLGIVLAGLPAVAMAYLGEEVSPAYMGTAMGLYISGNIFGGMSGRILTGALMDVWNWRVGLIGVAVMAAVSCALFIWKLPPSRRFEARPLPFGRFLVSLWEMTKHPQLLKLYCIGFLLMGAFVSLYNYIAFLWTQPPYGFSASSMGWVYVTFVVGLCSSAWLGQLADKYGRGRVLLISMVVMTIGAILTLHNHLLIMIIGISVFTFGFFGSHSITSGWVSLTASKNKAQAASMYLLFYYMGSSVGGTLGGLCWSVYGWSGIISLVAVSTVTAILILHRIKTLPI
jgi:YNFM family putative membrane transporter